MLAQTSLFPQVNEFRVNNYGLGILFKCAEGIIEAGPQLVIQMWLILQDHSPSMYEFC